MTQNISSAAGNDSTNCNANLDGFCSSGSAIRKQVWKSNVTAVCDINIKKGICPRGNKS